MLTPRTLFLVLLLASPLAAAPGQGSAGSSGQVEPRFLVHAPTAGMLRGGAVCLDTEFYREGGLLVGVSVGIFDRFGLGISYGGTNVIGTGSATVNPLPGFSARLRPLDETPLLPAIVLGFDSQGKSGYLKEANRYVIKSAGLFAVLSKNYAFLGYLSLHGGVNYTFERSDGDSDINFFAGLEKTVGPTISLVLEYNLGANDDAETALGTGGTGYLHAGVRWSIGEGITLGFNLEDLTRNSSIIDGPSRTVRLEYVSSL